MTELIKSRGSMAVNNCTITSCNIHFKHMGGSELPREVYFKRVKHHGVMKDVVVLRVCLMCTLKLNNSKYFYKFIC